MNLQDWIGRTETVEDIATATPYAALSATLDYPDTTRPAAGTPLPSLWHWPYFLPVYAQSEIGTDGHAKRGGFMPPVALPRRMWAGSDFEFHAPLLVRDALQRTSTIVDVKEKSGRAGEVNVELAWALRVLQAWQASSGGVILLDGKMVDSPVVLKVERIAALADLIN